MVYINQAIATHGVDHDFEYNVLLVMCVCAAGA